MGINVKTNIGKGEVQKHPDYLSTVKELLFQLADDDFIISYRGSEWLGLAPHIEEDVAFSSITQNTMGHAAIYYELLEELGVGPRDDLAHIRPVDERKNAILLELENGSGHYLHEPNFDWAFTVIRHYLYETNKHIRLQSLKHSSYQPIAEVAEKILLEQYYHIIHWENWFEQLMKANEESRLKMIAALEKAWDQTEDLITLGPKADQMKQFHLIEDEQQLRETFLHKTENFFANVGIAHVKEPRMTLGNGREGQHLQALSDALTTLSEVYTLDLAATW